MSAIQWKFCGEKTAKTEKNQKNTRNAKQGRQFNMHRTKAVYPFYLCHQCKLIVPM